MSSFALRLAGHPALKQQARAVPTDRMSVQPLLRKMMSLLRSNHARGLAAPQLGQSLRLMLVHSEDCAAPWFAFNPRITQFSASSVDDWESCLSVPEYIGLVRRPRRVQVEYENEDGESVSCTLSGDRARVFQHELDHLEGVLYTERIVPGTLTHVSCVHFAED
mmetsp:Transcript_16021/g.34804  ORF Transcript_16021/g.34804 Transcript_16021/m.34804 type:complete len:164 (-) Transcript_16021:545-1036(-)|eukprot:CAMPEP_0183336698 /NCGR_PEP_ID=MMETSP0164_2-20130417/4593_1 /TAXON_ID=221442 /ORGANISM="Coccolithus pelagicus ssp braarudi, Strain PLY182g" /LENGTH=163 /DNA_ID=CAMNT_0025506269 /DNA_START=134 /DNA_END=625 /DNA_ORIENTATION=+